MIFIGTLVLHSIGNWKAKVDDECFGEFKTSKKPKKLVKYPEFLYQAIWSVISKHMGAYLQHYNTVGLTVTYRDIIPLSGINTTFEQA